MKKGILSFIIILLFGTISGFAKKSNEVTKGVWLTNVGSDAMFSYEGMVKVVEDCEKYGINTIYTVTWNRGYTLYPSSIMEDQFGISIDPKFEGRDPLKELIDLAKPKGIKVVAWFEFGFSYRYKDEGNTKLMDSRPDWVALDNQGNPAQKNNFYWMNAFNPEVQQFLTSLVLEVVNNYDVDGIQGDDRMPALPSLAGYEPYTIEKYKQAHGGAAPPQDYKEEGWVQWRSDILTHYLTDLYDAVKKADPECMVSMAPSIYPWCKSEYLQDWPQWIKNGKVDEICPQVYRYSFEAYEKTLQENVLDHMSRKEIKKLLNPGILLKVEDFDAQEDLLKQIVEHNRSKGIPGETWFYYQGLPENDQFFSTYPNM
ncbi:glycoside hydrolase family 10 protein [Persicobacter diffluens]|uniref:Glycosyl hydrolase-like 10 domain-containing protein n=1 Tax=Persicobacter diffluens TaxID=981 RepID=A0AAN4W0D0_9BACT|nr:hypothetical protein PEDI_39260 [Persicobacter diffluens]